jgi:ubiquinone/menaquinone biosynthesis C-methylase UbiE
MIVNPNNQYNIAAPDSLAIKLAGFQRERMYQRFLKATDIQPQDTLLDVGATSDRSYLSSNYVEAWYPHKIHITAIGLDESAAFLGALYPGLTFIVANGLDLPFADESFDIVHSSAVLEHVGSRENQARLIAECARVARKSAFMTTPNRWFPIEFHTSLPLVHWLPKPAFRALMRRTGRSFFAQEANLNLMSSIDLRRSATSALANGKFQFKVETISLAGWPSNLLLTVRRRDSEARRAR